jgi:hypothetical protein
MIPNMPWKRWKEEENARLFEDTQTELDGSPHERIGTVLACQEIQVQEHLQSTVPLENGSSEDKRIQKGLRAKFSGYRQLKN